MDLPALEIEGDVHARLHALESYYLGLAKACEDKPIEQYGAHIQAVASILKQVQDLRFHFNHLRMKHSAMIERALAGEDSVISLNYQEALLVDTIRETHTHIWNMRRERIEKRTGLSVEAHAKAKASSAG